MRLIAIDPSLSSTGVAIFENGSLVYVNKITTTSKETEEFRIYKIAKELSFIIQRFEVTESIQETQFVSRNVKTALQLSRLRGAILYMLYENNVKAAFKTPSEVRQVLLDNGSADKLDVAQFVQTAFPDNELVKNLGEFNDRTCKDKNSDMYDAISIGLAYIKKPENNPPKPKKVKKLKAVEEIDGKEIETKKRKRKEV